MPAEIIAQLKMTMEFQGDVCVVTLGSQEERITALAKLDTTAKPRRQRPLQAKRVARGA